MVCILFKHLVFPRRMELYLFFHSESDLRLGMDFRFLIETCLCDLLCLLYGSHLQIFPGLQDLSPPEMEGVKTARLQRGHLVRFRENDLQQGMRFYHENQQIEQGSLLVEIEGKEE